LKVKHLFKVAEIKRKKNKKKKERRWANGTGSALLHQRK